ncbi:hypothetical protein HMF8227_00911 [Saliniradius amylolyticus]|uniref:Uncharacterized protein n=1 Tax=Saliniradius amylolyticus TaxID=2183582 RepID=A0A2S2E1A4_9ALTE|nr:AhpA/YtjB family protein [Saliniradius amylolyticus]AWL11406.1 hypothetical protein HMF8227_00911 [Saliniradius amylolyticus]
MAQKILLTEPVARSSPYTVYKRLFHLGLAGITLILALNVWVFGERQDAQVQQNLANQLGKTLTRLGAQIAARLEVEPESMTAVLSATARDPHVISATLYNDKGQVMGHQGNNESLLSLQKQTPAPLVYVQEIRLDDDIKAYLRLLLNRSQVLQHHQKYQASKRYQTELLMALAFMLGIFLTRGFYKFRARRNG